MSDQPQDKYPRITRAQFDIWIDSPVTKVYLQCLGWLQEQVKEEIGAGGFIDSTNNDRSMNLTHSAIGKVNGLAYARDPLAALIAYEMVVLKEEEAA